MITLQLNNRREVENLQRLLDACGDFSGDLVEIEEVYDKLYHVVERTLKKIDS